MRKINNRKNHTKTAKTIEDNFYLTGIVILFISATAAAISFFNPGFFLKYRLPPCLFHLLTGCYCPGCGGTRAVQALLRGHILQSFRFHPAVPYGAAVYLCFMLTQTIERASRHKIPLGMRYRNCYVWIATAIIIGNFAVKNILRHFYGFVL